MPVELRKLWQPVIIATKGLPCTGKSEFGRLIGQWAKCPVLYIDHFLDAVSLANGYSAELLPSPEQGDRLHRLAFDALCKAASDSLQWGVDIGVPIWRYKCIVVKSRLCSTFELDRLLQLARGCGCGTILIIEFQMKNEYRSRLRLEHKVESRGQYKQEWYKPRSWKDVEKANDDYDAHNWDLHLCRRLFDNYGDGLPRVTRLVLDPFDHLYLVPFASISTRCQEIINFLLGGGRVEIGRYLREENIGNIFVEGRYAVVQFGEVGRYLREKNLRGLRARRGPCYARGYLCVFKYWEEHEDKDESNPDYCGVCEKHVISGQPAYGCLNCTITLHKPCAEQADIVTLEGYQDLNQQLRDYPSRLPLRKHACKSCLEKGKHFSHGCLSCNFQTHLKCGVLPTILNHDCHPHFLFMCLHTLYKCEACGIDRYRFGGCYYCYICDKKYDIECVSLARKGEHEHGGHRHILKLNYTREGMEEEESYWCDICYADIDPQNWFYSCQDCPYFSAHPNCARHSIRMGSLQNHIDRSPSLIN